MIQNGWDIKHQNKFEKKILYAKTGLILWFKQKMDKNLYLF